MSILSQQSKMPKKLQKLAIAVIKFLFKQKLSGFFLKNEEPKLTEQKNDFGLFQLSKLFGPNLTNFFQC